MDRGSSVRACRVRRSMPLCVVALALALTATTGRSADVIVFGPQTFIRSTGGPVTVTRTFTVAAATTEGTLRLANQGVSSAIVSLNGAEVLRPDDFNPDITTIERTVTL